MRDLRRRSVAALLAAVSAIAAASAARPPAAPAQPPRAARECGDRPGEVPCRWRNGVYLVSGFAARYDVRDRRGTTLAEAAVDRLVRGDRNGLVVLVVELFKGRDDVIRYREGMTANDQNLLDASRRAHRRGAKVAIRLKVESARGGVGTDACRGQFAASYLSHVDHYAEVASDAHAEWFVVAGGLTKAFEDACDGLWDGYWHDVLYSASSRLGPRPKVVVSFAADRIRRMLGAGAGAYGWVGREAASGRLDAIGVAGAFPLTGRPTARVAPMVAGWRAGGRGSPFALVRALHRTYHRPILLDGIGFPRCPGATAEPANASCSRHARGARRTQSRAVQATYCFWTGWQREHPQARWFRGLWWWAYDLTVPRYRSPWHVGRRGRARTPAARIAAWNMGRGSRRSCG
ncbi:MAG TPA: hypothetical protein VFR97_06375 [Capillimicrobium sp.]|nr:hypothetical protein [Capillimicrobium sp.]